MIAIIDPMIGSKSSRNATAPSPPVVLERLCESATHADLVYTTRNARVCSGPGNRAHYPLLTDGYQYGSETGTVKYFGIALPIS